LPSHIISIDQGTTSTRAFLFDDKLAPVGFAQLEFSQIFPQPGWVEHDPQGIWTTAVATARAAMASADVSASEVAAIGITNQRETTIIWDRKTGKPIHNAIVWQDRRTHDMCTTLKEKGHEELVCERTGLLLDPYFSATKIAWLLDNVAGAREAANAGKLAFGTVDTYLLWHLTGGKSHLTDATNAARTLLLDIRTGQWDAELLDLFRIPASLLPEVRDCASDFGTTLPHLLGAPVRLLGIAGDQQAATIGQGCFRPGMMKATYGTGGFALLNTGDKPVRSQSRLLTTIAYQLDGKRTYALEGAIFIAGASVQWLRDGLKLIATAAETGTIAAQADPADQVYMVPAFVGLGAPWWDAEARAALYGLSRKSGPPEISRAALEAVGYQTRDLLNAMRADWPGANETRTVMRVDGGMTASDYTLQFLADITEAPVDRPMFMETTALGAAYLAGRQAGIYPDLEGFAETWKLDRRFEPKMDAATRERKWSGWQDAVRRTLTSR
jgi:glycerol kinase